MQTRCRLFSQSQSALCFIWQTSSVAIINSVTQSNSNGNSCIFKTENPNLHLDTHSEPNKNIHYTPLIASKTQSSSIRTRLLQSHMLWSSAIPWWETQRTPLERQEADWQRSAFCNIGVKEVQGWWREAWEVHQDPCAKALENGFDCCTIWAWAPGRGCFGCQGLEFSLPLYFLLHILIWVAFRVSIFGFMIGHSLTDNWNSHTADLLDGEFTSYNMKTSNFFFVSKYIKKSSKWGCPGSVW